MVAVIFQQGQLLETILNHLEPFWIYSIYGRDPTSCDLSAALGVNDVPHRRIRNQLGPDASPQFHMEKSTPSLGHKGHRIILQHPATSSPDLLAFPAHGLLALQAVHKGLNPCIQALASLCSCQHILTERSLHPNTLTCRQLLKACHTLLAANLLNFFPLQDWPNAAITCNYSRCNYPSWPAKAWRKECSN